MRLDDLRLDVPTLKDVPKLHQIYSDPRVWTHLPTERHTELEQTEGMIRTWIDNWEKHGLSA